MIRFLSSTSSSETRGICLCVDLLCPRILHARLSETFSSLHTQWTTFRLLDGLKSFPWSPPSKWLYQGKDLQPVSLIGCSLARVPLVVWPAPPASLHTLFATCSTWHQLTPNLRITSSTVLPWLKRTSAFLSLLMICSGVKCFLPIKFPLSFFKSKYYIIYGPI